MRRCQSLQSMAMKEMTARIGLVDSLLQHPGQMTYWHNELCQQLIFPLRLFLLILIVYCMLGKGNQSHFLAKSDNSAIGVDLYVK